MTARAWSLAEDALLRRDYCRLGASTVAVKLGRTFSSVAKRAARLGVQSHRRWTAKDDALLRAHWEGGSTLEWIAGKLRRSKATTYWRAQHLGLPLGVPPGYEYLSAAAKRTGYSAGQLRRILAWAAVPVSRTLSRPTKAPRRFHCVDPFEVDEALAKWHATETIEGAARARWRSAEWLVARLRRSGVAIASVGGKAKAHRRVPSEAIERALAL
jgi:hypothetical protein